MFDIQEDANKSDLKVYEVALTDEDIEQLREGAGYDLIGSIVEQILLEADYQKGREI